MNITDFTMRCGAGSHCRHSLCEDCGRALRANGLTADHPGTTAAHTVANCKRCYKDAMKLTPEDLQDQRHILLSDEQMAHIYSVDTFMFDWHLRRRFRLQIGEAA